MMHSTHGISIVDFKYLGISRFNVLIFYQHKAIQCGHTVVQCIEYI